MPPLKAARVEVLIWVLIYGGLLALSLGVFVSRQGGGVIAVVLYAIGILAVLAGAVLVWVRSRMPGGRA